MCVIARTHRGELRQYLMRTSARSAFYCRIRKLPIQRGWESIDIVQSGELEFLIKKRRNEYKCEVRKIISGELVTTLDCARVLKILGTQKPRPVLTVKEEFENPPQNVDQPKEFSLTSYQYSKNELHQTCKTWKAPLQSFDYKFMYKGKLFGYRDKYIVIADAMQPHVQKEVEIDVPSTTYYVYQEIVAYARKGNVLAVISWFHYKRNWKSPNADARVWFYDMDRLLASCMEGSQKNYTLAEIDICERHYD